MPSNEAAYLLTPKARSLEVQAAPYPTAGPSEIIIQTHAIALNPMEWKVQDYNPPIGGSPLSYPLIMGSDVAGTVVEIGSDVSTRKVGQRVILNAHGIATRIAAQGGFQKYVLAGAEHAVPIPERLDFEHAVVLPLAFDTAAAGLFGADQLRLELTQLRQSSSSDAAEAATEIQPRGTVLIWGGSSSVGCCAIQLAVAAGYTVFSTASARNHDLCLELGAAKVFDYAASDIEKQIIDALVDAAPIVGALDCIADKDKTMSVCARILSAARKESVVNAGGEKIRLVTVLSPPAEELAAGVQVVRLMIPSFLRSDGYGVARAWLTRALAEGKMQCKPEPKVVGHGLEDVQKGIDLLRKGVSATKLVVML